MGQVGRLARTLRLHRRIALDTSIFIYHVERNPRYFSFTERVFSWIEREGNSAVTSTITLAELLVPAYREGVQQTLADYRGLLKTHPTIRWIDADREVADLTARIRATYRLKTPDAIQVATAIVGNATLLVTNDPEFKRVSEVESIVLEELL